MKYLHYLLFSLVLSITTTASDYLTYPGAMGVPWSENEPGPTLNNGGIWNASPRRFLRIDLPIVRSLKERNISRVVVSTVDQHWNRKDISAAYAAVWWSGCRFNGVVTAKKFSRTTCNGSNIFLYPRTSGLVSNAHAYVSVQIPPKYNNRQSGVISYQVNQR